MKKPQHLRVSSIIITADANNMYKSNIQEKTVRRHALMNIVDGVPRTGRGRISVIPWEVESALVRAMRSYIELTNAEMKKKPNRQNLIKLLEVCLQSGGTEIKRYDCLYNRLMVKLADKVHVNTTSSKMEQRRLEWTTFQNINKWFDSLKEFFVKNKFARVATEEDKLKGVEGELVFLESQTHRIINLDESEVSTDGTSKLSGGRPVTELSASDAAIPTGANTAN